MSNFSFQKLELKDAYLIDYFHVGDNRGFFSKIFEKDIYKDAGIDFSLNETFVSLSSKNVIRGLHFQLGNPQAKIVSVLSGKIWDVIVDLRPDSKTFKQWKAFELSSDNHLAIYIPKGYAHGFACLEDDSVMLYQCEEKYNPSTDTGIRFDDPEIGIEWPIDLNCSIHSERDLNLLSWDDFIRCVKKDRFGR